MKQDNGESVDAYMKTVRILARECKHADTNEHMLDTLIFGTNSEHVQSKRIQRDETLSLDNLYSQNGRSYKTAIAKPQN